MPSVPPEENPREALFPNRNKASQSIKASRAVLDGDRLKATPWRTLTQYQAIRSPDSKSSLKSQLDRDTLIVT